MRMALEDEGYDVDEAGSGEIALEHFAEQPADVVLIDLMLPGMDGFECCRQLRRTSTVPVIMVTARSDTHDVVAGLEAGADDYVNKPLVAKEAGARLRAPPRWGARARGGGRRLCHQAVRRQGVGCPHPRPAPSLAPRGRGERHPEF